MSIYQINLDAVVPFTNDDGGPYVLLGNMTADKATAIDAESNVHHLQADGADTFSGLVPGAHLCVLADRDTDGRLLFERIAPTGAAKTVTKQTKGQKGNVAKSGCTKYPTSFV